MKRIIQITLAATLFLFSASFIFAAEVSVSIDGVPVEFTQESGSPFIDENNKVQVPLRQTLEAFGATVEWHSEARTVIAEKDGITVWVPIDTNHIYKSYMYRRPMRITNDTTSVIVDGRTYLPIGLVFNALGADVSWDGANRTIMVVSEGETITIKGMRFSTALPVLDLSDMYLENEDIISLRYMTNLTELNLTWNRISDLSPLLELTNLIELDLSDNNIFDLSPLSELTNLTELHLQHNLLYLGDLSPLSNLTNLERLNLGHNRIRDLSSLSELTSLTRLTLNSNIISDLSPMEGLTNLKALDLSWNIISDISPLSELMNLSELDLSVNDINDLSPLSELTNLSSLNLNYNQISDLAPLSGLEDLISLGLSDNQISDLTPLTGLTRLRWIILLDNPVADWSPVEHVSRVDGRP